MSAMATQITGVSIVCSAVCSGGDQRKHQSSASVDFVRGINRWPVKFPDKVPVTREMLPFDDVVVCFTFVIISKIGKYLYGNIIRLINSLWPSDALWRQRSGSTLAQVIAWCRHTALIKPLPGLMLTYHQSGPATFITGKFHKRPIWAISR